MSRLLLVEDDADARLVTRRALEEDGHTVLEASRGREALEVVGHEQIDGMLLDISLGDMEGMAVLRRVRAQPELRELPIVVLSGHASEATIEEAHELGCSAYLIKPVEREALRRTLEQVLR